MRIDEIEIYSGRPEFLFEPIRRLEVKCEASNALMPAPTIDEANGRLRALAAKVGANAIIEADYQSGISFTSRKSLKATGLAVRRTSDERLCPFCAEPIKLAAVVCKHCGRDVAPADPDRARNPADSIEGKFGSNGTYAFSPDQHEPLRDNNNPAIVIGLVILGIMILGAILASAGG